MQKVRLFCIIALSALAPNAIFGQGHADNFTPKTITPADRGIQFIENKGQWNKGITHISELPSGYLYLRELGFSYAFFNEEDLANMNDHGSGKVQGGIMRYHIFSVDLVNAETEKVKGAKPFTEYRNYYIGDDPEMWASHVNLYAEVNYQSVYSNIDMSVYSSDFDLKYDFIVNPEGNPDQIKLQYNGLSELFIRDGNLHMLTSVNTILEQRPYAYQLENGKQVQVPCEFRLIAFDFPDGYNSDIPLIVDPKLIFSTFSGSFTDNWGFTATFDTDGHLFSGGIVFAPGYATTPGDTGFLPTPGAYQTSFAGGTFYACDMGIIKYTPDGASRVFATYLGGSFNECPHSLVVNGAGELLILGTTGSADFPTTSGAYDTSFNGGNSITSSSSIQYFNGSDLVVAKLSPDGTALMASTFVGGTGNDGLNISTSTRYNYGDDFRGEIIVDGSGNSYIASTTASTDFPIVSGFQPTFGGGTTDACTFKLNSNLSALVWSSYLGGSGDDAGYAVQFDLGYDVYVCGGTTSLDFPTTPGVLNPTIQGGVDGYVTHISNGGSTLIAATYIGTASYDQSYFVQLDTNNNVYLLGQSEGTYSIIPDSVIGVIYSNPGGNQFIHKLNNSLSETIYSTIYGTGGGIPNISPSAFLINNCENVFVSGWGGVTNQQGSTFGMPVTSNAYQPTTDGSDFHLLVLFKNAESLLYATFFGGPISAEHVDGGTSRFDKNGIVYQSVCGGCGANSDYPTTPGVWSNTNNSPNCNNASFKLDMSDINAQFSTLPDNEGCLPFTANFINESTGGLTFFWDYGDSSYSTLFQGTHVYTDTGTFLVTLVVTDSTTCQVVDSATAIVIVHPLPDVLASPDIEVCPGGSAVLNVSGGSTYLWNPPTYLSCINCQTPTVTPDTNITYLVYATDTNGCMNHDTVEINILPTPVAVAGLDVTICTGNTVILSSSGGVTYSWSPDSTLLNANTSTPMAFPSVTTDYVVTVFDSNGCQNSDTLTVTVQNFIAAEAGNDTVVCIGDTLNLNASGGASYIWTPQAGLSDPFIANPTLVPDTTMVYYVNVSSGTCDDDDSVIVTVNPLPVANTGPDPAICQGDVVTLSASGAINFLWSTTETTSDIDVSPDSTTTYSVLVTDSIGCSDSTNITVFVNLAPVADAGPDTIICQGESVVLTGSGGVTYLWNSSKPGQSTTESPTGTTVYWVTVFDTIGCPNTDSVEVEVIPIPVASIFTSTNSDCRPYTAAFVSNSTPVDSSVTYFWNFGDPTSGALNFATNDSVQHTYQNSGNYTVTLEITHGLCKTTALMDTSIAVVVYDIPTAGIAVIPDVVTIYDPTVVITDNSQGAQNCILITSSGDTLSPCNNIYSFPDSGHFQVMQIVYNALGCADTAYGEVYVKPGFSFFIANTFTPNGDGMNDIYFGKGIGIKQFEFVIYNRWGDRIFTSKTIEEGWDGRANNGREKAQQDVYIYVINLTDYKDYPHQYIGHVTLLD